MPSGWEISTFLEFGEVGNIHPSTSPSFLPSLQFERPRQGAGGNAGLLK